MSPGRLAGLGVVVTRPRRAAEPLAARLAAAGACPWVFPALEIEDVPPDAALEALLRDIGRFDLAIFVSANAVEKGMAAVRRAGARWPAGLRVAAVGEATAEALRNSGMAAVISPSQRHDSEALLALPQLRDVKGQNIIVFRGEGGRERLREGLEERGASVVYAQCYRRVRPGTDPAALQSALARGEVHAVSALSGETLGNFVAMIGSGAAHLAKAALVVPHEAVAAHPDARRFARVLVAPPAAEGLIETLAQLRITP
jgi:uroporphyrinogen-III synthase